MKKSSPLRILAATVLLSAALCSEPARAQITVGGNGSNTTDSTAYTGAQTLTKIGTNTVTLTGDSNYTGVTTINAGTLLLDKSAGAQLYKTGGYFGIGDAVTVNTGGTFQTWNWNYGANNALSELMTNYTAVVLNGGKVVVDDTFSADRAFTVGAGGATLETTAGNTYTKVANSSEFNLIRFTANSNLTVGGEGNTVINDALGSFGNTGFSITKNGTGTLTLGGSNSYTGGTTVNAGTLSLSAANRLANSGAVTVNGGSFNLGGFSDTVGAVTLAGGSIANGTLTGSSYAVRNGTVSAVLAGTGALTKTTAGTVTLTADNTFNGTTTINSGTLVLDKAAGAQLFKTGGYLGLDNAVTVNTGGTLQTWNWGYGANNALSELMTNYTGIVLNGGKIVIDDTFSSDRGFSVGANGGTIETTAGNTYTKPAAIHSANHIRFTANSTLTVGGDGNTVIGEALSSLGGSNGFSIAKNGTGTLTLGGNNTYTGTTTISGGTLRVGTGSTSGTLGSGAISNNGTLVFDRSNAISVANTMTGIGSLTKNGSGTLTLTGSAGHTGGTTINAGTLSIGANNTLSDSGTVTINSGGTFNMGSFGDYIGTLVMNGNATVAGTSGLGGGQFLITQGLAESPTTKTLTATGSNNTIATNIGISSQWGGVGNNANLHFNVVGASDTLSVSGVIANLAFDGGGNATTGSITKNGAGTLTLNGSNTYTGGTTVNSGTLRLGAANRLADSGAVNVSGGTLNLGGFSDTVGAVTLAGGSIANGTLTGSSYAVESGTVSAVLAGSGALTKSTEGSVTLSGNNTYTGLTTINAGTLATSGNNRIAIGNSVIINSGGTFALGGDQTLASVTGSGTIQLGDHILNTGATSSTFNGTIAGNGGLTKSGAGSFTLSGVGTFIGDTNITGGTLVLSSANALSNDAVVLMNPGTTLTVNQRTFIGALEQGGGTVNGPGELVATLTLTNNGTLNAILADGPDYAAGILKRTSGTTTVGAANSFTGAVKIQGGTLQLGTGGSFADASSLVMSPGGTMNLNNKSQTFSAISGQGGTVAMGNGSLTVNQATDTAYNGIVTGSGSLTKQGAGTLTLGGGNTYSGGTTVSAGKLAGTTTSLQGAITNNALVEFAQETDGTYSGNMGGTGELVKSGSGTVTLSGSNTHSGGTTISEGRLVAGTANLQGNMANNAAFEIAQNSTGTYAGNINGSGSLTKSGNGSVTLDGTNTYSGGTTVSAGRLIGTTSSLQGNIDNSAAVEFSQAANGTYLGSVSGSGSLTKSGSGAVTLAGSNTYTGATLVTAGSLVVNGSLATSDVTVESGATLGGNATVAGTVTLNSGAVLNPGNSIGSMTLDGGLSLSSSSTIRMEMLSADGISDKITVAGTLQNAGHLVISTSESMPSGDFSNTYTLFQATAFTGNWNSVSLEGTYTGNFTFSEGSWIHGSGDTLWTYDQSLGTLSVVPEPSVYALLVVGAAFLVWRRWNRSRRVKSESPVV